MFVILLTILASSLDSFMMGIFIGTRNIQLRRCNLMIISLFPFIISLASMTIGRFLLEYMNKDTTTFLTVTLYLFLAIYSFVTARKQQANETWMDKNNDQKITGVEIITVGFTLSIDTLIIALPLAFQGYSIVLCAALFALGTAYMMLFGHLVSRLIPSQQGGQLNKLSWLFYLMLGLRRLF